MRSRSLHDHVAQELPISQNALGFSVINTNKIAAPLRNAYVLASDLFDKSRSEVLKEAGKLPLIVGQEIDRGEHDLAGKLLRSIRHYQHLERLRENVPYDWGMKQGDHE